MLNFGQGKTTTIIVTITFDNFAGRIMKKKTVKRRKTKRQKQSEGKRIFLLTFGLAIATLIVILSMRSPERPAKMQAVAKFHPVFTFSVDPEQARIDSVIARNSQQTYGIDLSHNQKEQSIQWDNLKIANGNMPVSFVIIRATMGVNGEDKHFDSYWANLKNHKIIRGAYHYYRPHSDPVRQANWYIQHVNFEKGDLLPILDVEVRPKDMSLQQFQGRLKTWLTLVERATGKKPIIYSFYTFYRDYLKDAFPEYPTWLANYNDVSVPARPEDPWIFWQFAEQGQVIGIDGKVDLNVFNGSKTELKRYTIQ